VKIVCPSPDCSASIPIEKTCVVCGRGISHDFIDRAKEAESGFLELPELIAELNIANQNIIVDIPRAEQLYGKAKKIRNILSEFQYHNQKEYDTLNQEIITFYSKICVERQRLMAESTLKDIRREEDTQEQANLEKQQVEAIAMQELRRRRNRKVLFSILYFIGTGGMIFGLFLFKKLVEPQNMKDSLIGFFALLGAGIGILGSIPGCIGGLIVGALFGIFINWLLLSLAGNIIAAILMVAIMSALYKYLMRKESKK
jgi:hypothetical protein